MVPPETKEVGGVPPWLATRTPAIVSSGHGLSLTRRACDGERHSMGLGSRISAWRAADGVDSSDSCSKRHDFRSSLAHYVQLGQAPAGVSSDDNYDLKEISRYGLFLGTFTRTFFRGRFADE
ncbi:hypothetical protein PanWU01x14_370810 [Parasponia andersonii]|uniref:Uncharacterized protein n=1 Tax=Parasponia andersonii TaxID=3476 RepID=A0A2P5A441_PARAD|nr:hypothetical protein PanWU01x14_370810 [Parasponia andersonii]